MNLSQKPVNFANQAIGDEYPCFITFEAGPTHEGLKSAKKLVDLAAEAGANAIKFQILDPDRLVADKKQLFSYDVLLDKESGKTETISEPLYNILERRALSHNEWRDLKTYSDAKGLAFFATVAFEDEIQLLEEMGCDSIKIASADVNHFPLIKRAASTGMCLQLDTGNSTLGEIEKAVDFIHKEGNDNIIIHQCPSGYPARLESVNLRIIPTLRRMFKHPVAYSDHTPGWEMDIAAVTMGANLVEKTITLDRTTRSVEHIMSLEPHQMKSFVKSIRDLEVAMGSSRRIMRDEELEKRDMNRRSVWVMGTVEKGQRLCDADVEFRRPGTGITPELYMSLLDMKFKHDISAEKQLELNDLIYSE